MTAELTVRRLGPYIVGEVLGRGGTSVVYGALDERLGGQWRKNGCMTGGRTTARA